MLSLNVLPLSFVIIVSIWLFPICLSFLLREGEMKVKSIESVFSLMGVTIDAVRKSFVETEKLWTFSSIDSQYLLYKSCYPCWFYL